MPAVRQCVICERPLDEGRKRRRDAVTCSASCRTLLWRARRKVRHGDSVPYADVNGDGSGSPASFEPPAFHPGPTGDDRFYAQAALDDEGAIEITQAERLWMRRNPGPMHPDVQRRILDREVARRQREAEEAASHRGLKPESRLDPSSRGAVARQAMESRRLNRPADPYERTLQPRRPGPPRHPSAIEAECIDAPWARTTARESAGW